MPIHFARPITGSGTIPARVRSQRSVDATYIFAFSKFEAGQSFTPTIVKRRRSRGSYWRRCGVRGARSALILRPLSPPPPDFARVKLPLAAVKGRWFRSHDTGLKPIHYGTGVRYRFDDPEGKYGVLYVARHPSGAFIETFGELVSVAELPRTITSQELSRRGLCELVCDRPLRLVDLTGKGLARVGVDARICVGDDYPLSQLWSKAFHDHPSRVDGLLYRCRHDPEQIAAAIFYGTARWTELSRSTWLSLGLVLRDILNAYNFALIETQIVEQPVRKGPTQSELF